MAKMIKPISATDLCVKSSLTASFTCAQEARKGFCWSELLLPHFPDLAVKIKVDYTPL